MDIAEQNRFIGLDRWHSAGFTGKGVNVWNTEGIGSHADIVQRRIITDSAPDCTLFRQSISDMTHAEIETFVKANKIKILTRSIGAAPTNVTKQENFTFWETMKTKYKLILFNSGGNDEDDESEFGGWFPPEVALYIGGCYLFKGVPKLANYNSQYDEIDFVTFTGLWNGSSFAAPYLAGQAACLVQRYGDITQSQIVELFARNVIPIDGISGYGLPTMGDPAEELKTSMNGSLLLERYVLTSPFGWRIHPVTGIKTFHNGTDYATCGQPPIFSPYDGTVKKVSKDQYGANFVYIDYGAYVGLAYHCSKIIVSVGKQIIKGQVIGYCGSTGRSTGEHLHWGWIKKDGKEYDYYNATYIDWESDWMIDIRDIKILVGGAEKGVKAILYKGENYVRLRDFEDKLGVVDVEYDPVKKIPTIED